MVAGVSIDEFRGDYEELERMAHASWRDEYGEASFPNFYRAVNLVSWTFNPGISLAGIPVVYEIQV